MALNAKPADIFPDIHHKMSKKIAQLTKVIYLLNTKNEDHQAELDAMTASHQSEVQQILRDATAKISKFKESVETRQNQVNQEALLEKLTKKHDAEKQQAMKEFQTFKSKATEKEAKIVREYQDKFDGLQAEIETMNGRFKEKITAFELANKDLKVSLEQARNLASGSEEELRTKHEVEMADLVRTNNDKYQSMIIDQLRIQEELRAEMLRAVEAARKETKEGMKAEMEKMLGQMRAQLSGDKQESMLSLKREWEEKLQSQRDEFTLKLEKALGDIKIRDAQIIQLQSEKGTTEDSLSAKLNQIQEALAAQTKESDSRLQALNESLAGLTDELSRTKSQLKIAEDSVAAAETTLTLKVKEIAELGKQVESLKAEIVRLLAELQQSKNAGAASESDMRNRMLAAEREMASLQASLAQSNGTLTSAQLEISQLKVAAQKATEQAEKVLAAVRKEKDALMVQLQDALNASKSSNDKASNELSSIRQHLAEREDSMRKEMATRQERHAEELEALRQKHASDLAQQQLDRTALEESWRRKQKEWDDESSRLQKSNADRLAALASEHLQVQTEAENRNKEETDRLKQTMAKLTGQMQEIADSADGEKTSLRGELSRLLTFSSSLKGELEAKTREGERAESICTGLKSQVESLREELKATQKAFREKMDASMAKSDAEWQAKFDAAELKKEREIALLLEAQQKALQSQYSDLTSKHEEDISALKAALQKEASSHSDESTRLEREKLRLEADLRAEKSSHLQAVSELSKKHNEETRELEERRRKELEALRKEHAGALAKQEGDLNSVKSMALKTQQEQAERAMEDALVKAESEKDWALSNADREKKEALRQLEKRLTEAQERALALAREKHDELVSGMRRDQDLLSSQLSQELDSTRHSLQLAQGEVKGLEGQLSSERQERARREQQFVLEKDQMRREHEVDIRKEKERADKLQWETSDRAASELKATKETHREEKTRLDDRVKSLQTDLSAMEQKYRDRESRSEDIARIRALEKDLVDKDELVQKTKEEMLYFKREMLNREDNYNLKFNSKPNVGVMNVLKSKDTDAGSTAGKKTQRPPANPVSAMSSNPGMSGLGLGIGGSNGQPPPNRTRSK